MSYLLTTRLGALRLNQNIPRLLKLGIIGAVLLFSALIVPRRPTESGVLIIGVISALLFLAFPPLGLLVLVVVSLLVPFAVSTGTETAVNATILVLVMLIGLWGVDGLARRKLYIFTARPLLPLFALCAVAVVSFLNGNQMLLAFAQTAPFSAQAAGLAIFLLSTAAFLLASQQMQDLRWLRRLTWVYLVLGGIYVFARLVPELSWRAEGIFQRGATANSLFWIWLVALAFGQAVYNTSLRWQWRIALIALVAATLYVGLYQAGQWTSGWLPPLVALLVALCVGRPRLGPLALAVGGILLAAYSFTAVDFVIGGANTYSTLTRVEAWRILGEIIKVSPWLGLGPSNYYWYTPLFPILGYNVNFSSHNNYVDIVAQIGLLGLACFLWFLWEMGRLGARLRKTIITGFGRAYMCGALGALAGMLVSGMLADWFFPFVYNIGLAGYRASAVGWVLLGGLVALDRASREEHPTTE